MNVELARYNPWWEDTAALDGHSLIRAWSGSRVKRDPGPRLAFQHDDLVYSLRGPRRVGKTTFVMREVQRLLQTVRPDNILYYSFEVENSPVDVVNVVREYMARFGGASGRRFLFLDEISNVANWQKAIKKLWDMGELAGCTVLVTGSHSTDVRVSAESMPGRRGAPGPDDPLDKILAPVSFGEYVALVDPRVKKRLDDLSLSNPLERIRMFLDLCDGSVDERLNRLLVLRDALESHLKNYLVSGGLPHVADELLARRAIGPATYAECTSSTKADLSLANHKAGRIFQILPQIADSLGTPVTWSSLKRGTDVSSNYMVEESIVALNDSFITFMLYRYNSETGMPKFNAAKKIYFSDPYFLHVLRRGHGPGDVFAESRQWIESPRHLPALVEQSVASHASRLAFDMSKNKHLFEYDHSVFYWQSRSGREVDVVISSGDGLFPIEVKYQNKIAGDDLYGLLDLRKAAGSRGGIVVTKDILGTRSGAALVPAALFLLLA